MREFTIVKTTGENNLTYSVKGRLDSITSSELQDTLITAFNENTRVTLDFEELTYISSAGLRVLLMAQKTASGRKGSFTIINVSNEIKEIFDMTGFTKILSINPAE